jgi:hypothetical protein
MKATRTLSILSLLALCVVSSCKKEDPKPSASELATSKLTAAEWSLNKLKVDDVDQTALFPNLSLSFTATSFITTNGEPVWPATGTWVFTNDKALEISRSDGLTVTLVELSDTKLVLALQWNKTTFEEGRQLSIEGEHIFEFTR